MQCIARLVPAGSRLIDVGTDHAYLPLHLLQNGAVREAVASDIHEGPLQRAMMNAAGQEENRISFVLTDGLHGIDLREGDTVVLAGMGGDLISDILSAANLQMNNLTFLLQPMTKQEVLRKNLSSLGLFEREEHLVKDAGRIYTILICENSGQNSGMSEAEYYTGSWELLCGDPLFTEHLAAQRRRFEKQIKGMEQAKTAYQSKDILRCQSILNQIMHMEELLNGHRS